MGAIATATGRLKLGTAVLIAPYRHPLNDARQLATADVLSGGRVLVGVGAGWLEEEFAALGLSFKERGGMTDECIEIYRRSWTDEVVSFSGRHYRFENLSMDPKPRAEAPTADRLGRRLTSRRQAGGAPVRRPFPAFSRSGRRSLPGSVAPRLGPTRARRSGPRPPRLSHVGRRFDAYHGCLQPHRGAQAAPYLHWNSGAGAGGSRSVRRRRLFTGGRSVRLPLSQYGRAR